MSSTKRRPQIAFHQGQESESDDDSWNEEPRREERYTRIRTRVPTGHPHLAKRLLEMREKLQVADEDAEESESESSESQRAAKKVSKRSEKSSKSKTKRSTEKSSKSRKKKPTYDDGYETTSDEPDPEVVVRTVKVPRKKTKPVREEVHIGRATVVDEDGDSSWDEDNRKQERYARIRKRVPTGHPGLAKKVAEGLRRQELMAEDDDELSDNEIEVVQSSKSRSSKRDAMKKRPTTKESIKFGEIRAVGDEDSEGSWEERKEERFNRIRSRVPTGHPGLAKKIAQMALEEDGSSSEPQKKRKSKSRSTRVHG